MNIRTVFAVLICIMSAVVAAATEYPDYYCYQEAPSYSLPFDGEIYTQGDYKVGDFYYCIINEEEREAAIVVKEEVCERMVNSEVACLYPTIRDWPEGTVGTFKGDVEIPSEVELEGKTYSVVMIGFAVFFGCKELRSVKIPDSVRFISSMAFRVCQSLTEIEIPAGAFIAKDALEWCTSLKTLDLSKSNFAVLRLRHMDSLETLFLPRYVPSWKGYSYLEVFYEPGLKEVWAPDVETSTVYPGLCHPTILEEATLYVPKGSLEVYREAVGWKDFKNIVEYEILGVSGVDAVEAGGVDSSVFYDMQGRSVAEPEQGVYIRRNGDKVEKVFIRK